MRPTHKSEISIPRNIGITVSNFCGSALREPGRAYMVFVNVEGRCLFSSARPQTRKTISEKVNGALYRSEGAY